MSLERFRRTKLVTLNRQAKAYQAARAMADNHIGAVLVSDPRGLAGIVTDRDLALAVLGHGLDPTATSLSEIMSEEVVTCDIGADLAQVARLMQEHGVRRIPVTDGGRAIGLVTLDDLVVEGMVGPEALRAIVTAQLEEEAPHKPAGCAGPGAASGGRRAHALARAKARAKATHDKLVAAVAKSANLDAVRAERALTVGICMLCRRLSPDEAHQLVAQLPSMLQQGLDQCVDGPDRKVTIAAIEGELGKVLGLDAKGARAALQAVCKAVAASVTAGEIAEVRGQLPADMRELFPLAS